jgi:hypothetical protein
VASYARSQAVARTLVRAPAISAGLSDPSSSAQLWRVRTTIGLPMVISTCIVRGRAQVDRRRGRARCISVDAHDPRVENCVRVAEDADSDLAGEAEELARRFGWFPRRSTLAGVRATIAGWHDHWLTQGPVRAFALRLVDLCGVVRNSRNLSGLTGGLSAGPGKLVHVHHLLRCIVTIRRCGLILSTPPHVPCAWRSQGRMAQSAPPRDSPQSPDNAPIRLSPVRGLRRQRKR